MNPPITYADWSHCLDLLVKGELQPSDLSRMEDGKLEWSKGNAARFSTRFAKAYNEVLKQSFERFQKNISRSGGHDHELIRSINAVRRTLTFLYQISLLQPIPDDLRKYLQSLVQQSAQQSQDSLEQTAKTDRTGHLTSLLKNNSVTNFDKEAFSPPVANTTSDNSQVNQPLTPKRRIIF